jgi:hypothetical protein
VANRNSCTTHGRTYVLALSPKVSDVHLPSHSVSTGSLSHGVKQPGREPSPSIYSWGFKSVCFVRTVQITASFTHTFLISYLGFAFLTFTFHAPFKITRFEDQMYSRKGTYCDTQLLLQSDALHCGRSILTFRRAILPPSSGWIRKIKAVDFYESF